jgi:hypothetical protein
MISEPAPAISPRPSPHPLEYSVSPKWSVFAHLEAKMCSAHAGTDVCQRQLSLGLPQAR